MVTVKVIVKDVPSLFKGVISTMAAKNYFDEYGDVIVISNKETGTWFYVDHRSLGKEVIPDKFEIMIFRTSMVKPLPGDIVYTGTVSSVDEVSLKFSKGFQITNNRQLIDYLNSEKACISKCGKSRLWSTGNNYKKIYFILELSELGEDTSTVLLDGTKFIVPTDTVKVI